MLNPNIETTNSNAKPLTTEDDEKNKLSPSSSTSQPATSSGVNKTDVMNKADKPNLLDNINPFESLSLKIQEGQEKMDALKKAQRTKSISGQFGSGSDIKRKSQFNFDNGKPLEEQQRDLEIEFRKNQDEYNKLLNTPSPFKI